MTTLKERIKRNPFYPQLKTARDAFLDRIVLLRWIMAGRPAPLPRLAKRAFMLRIVRKHPKQTFIETGTYLGEMVRTMLPKFQTIHSIEIAPALYEDAKRQFQKHPNIHLYLGDSATVLPQIISKLSTPAFFWLDGHYSGGVTGKGALETPIIKELESILQNPIRGHFILIDDARCFTGEHDYPTIDALKTFLLTIRPDAKWDVRNDIISIQL